MLFIPYVWNGLVSNTVDSVDKKEKQSIAFPWNNTV